MPTEKDCDMNNAHIKIETLSPQISVITLAQPKRHNALSLEMIEELCYAFTALEQTTCNVVILEAEGVSFSAGLDLKQAADEAMAEKMGRQLAHLFTILHNTALITLATLQGNAIAGGGGLAASCDLVFIAEEAKIGFPEVKKGLVAALVATVLHGQLSSRHLKELLLSGELIDSRRAVEIGLANHVVNSKELKQRVLLYAQEITKGAPQALKKTKDLFRYLEGDLFSTQLIHALSVYREARASQEAKDGIAAFLKAKG
jgi:enoyl-CoA hydratase/carnithine racemase